VIDQIALWEHESLLASALRPVAGELRLVDVGELVTAIGAQRFANLQDVVDSSAELYFRPGTLSFGWGADVRLGWAVPPSIGLEMEFQNRGLTVFFRLGLEGACASISIREVIWGEPCNGVGEEIRRLAQAIADARIDGEPDCCAQP
jgi:hypothetical protein